MIRCLLALVLTLVATATHADEIQVEGAFIPAPPPAAKAAAGYWVVTNHEAKPIVIVGARCEGSADCELHRSVIEDGMASMEPAGKIAVEPGASVRFEPGGLHMMIHGAELKLGDSLQFKVVLEDGRELATTAEVVRPGSKGPGADSKHPH